MYPGICASSAIFPEGKDEDNQDEVFQIIPLPSSEDRCNICYSLVIGNHLWSLWPVRADGHWPWEELASSVQLCAAQLASGVWGHQKGTSTSVIRSSPPPSSSWSSSAGWKYLMTRAEPWTLMSQTELREILWYTECHSVPLCHFPLFVALETFSGFFLRDCFSCVTQLQCDERQPCGGFSCSFK